MNPAVRSALYRNPRAVAKRFGLKNEEGKAMQTLKKSLLSTLSRKQTTQLEMMIRNGNGGDGGGGGGLWGICPPSLKCPPTPGSPA
ncbi:MAG TPA: hypothetical protein VMH05_26665 [Bryobacteraceae bacterium]|nr:hypothetical protein [Bryobacteraceae bacterium]